MDRLGIIILTYTPSVDHPRADYAYRTAKALVKHIRYSGPLVFHIADDGSPIEHVDRLRAMVSKVRGSYEPSYTMVERYGYGASYNAATQHLHWDCKYLLVIEDDWELTRPLNLDPLVAALDDGISCIRLGYIGWTQRLRGELIRKADQTFLGLDPDSEEPHVWAGHPRLETREFQRQVGPWPEGVDPGTTEFMVSQRKESRSGVAWPMDLAMYSSQHHQSLFTHIGAIQAREDQS